MPKGDRPDVAEALEQWHMLQAEGESKNLFGAKGLKAHSASRVA
ncbi:hypothetical protein [Roseobacter sp. CCS2]|nr:hypothetical protein [Roseobacter sp. CCS2]EBA11482.1 hypothetical protein RCCS2_02448 [Roseobacter sp. CCS2]